MELAPMGHSGGAPESAPWLNELIRAHSGLVPNDPDDDITGSTFKAVRPRAASTDILISQLQNLKNFRDLASSSSLLKPGLVFRSSSPIHASKEDWQVLMDKLGIRTMVDLRTKYEVKEDPVCSHIDAAAIWDADRLDMFTAESRLRQGDANQVAALHIHRISIQEWMPYLREFVWRLPWHRGLPIIGLAAVSFTVGRLLGWKIGNALRTRVIREINQEGLPTMYSVILDAFGPEIGLAMKVILDALRQGRAVTLCCKLGKDRTGLLTALVLACCGVSEHEIISDYIRSDSVVALEGKLNSEKTSGLDMVKFSQAPPEAMAHVLDHLNSVYGSPSDYLRRFGFHTGLQEELGTILTGSIPHIYLDDHHH
eukprot:jgi/Botrbrau1/6933/Bobra.0215s0012.1